MIHGPGSYDVLRWCYATRKPYPGGVAFVQFLTIIGHGTPVLAISADNNSEDL